MRKTCYTYAVVVAFLSTTTVVAQKENIELEPQAGFLWAGGSAGHGDLSGWKIGARASFGLSERFYIRPEISYAWMGRDHHDHYFMVPVYASYRIPVRQTQIHLNIGPYGMFGTYTDFGVSMDVGIEYKKWKLSMQYHQNLINSYIDRCAGLSLSYCFRVKE